jgi:signal transduction histidine kinase
MISIISLCSWWLYIIFKMSEAFEKHNIPPIFESNLQSMLKSEGITLVTLIIVLSLFIFYLLNRDTRKNKNLQSFFASLTHELKTPLASIRLQSEVLKSQIENSAHESSANLNKLSDRIIEDTARLEDQFEKILQLAKVERGTKLHLEHINLMSWIKSFVGSKLATGVDISVLNQDDIQPDIMGDEFALETIFKNLTENTRQHSAPPFKAQIEIQTQGQDLVLTYHDLNSTFTGDTKQLGKLFFKHNSQKGSGIGLYLCYKVAQQLNAQFFVQNLGSNGLKFFIRFKQWESIS